MPVWRARAIRCALVVAGAALAVEIAAAASLSVQANAFAAGTIDVRSVVIATLATAVLAMSSFYSAFEGIDDNLRRRP